MNRTIPKVSIIVPVYNVESFLCRCIDSILNQTIANFQLILVDDGSPDQCPQLCDAYSLQDNRIYVIHQENGGLSVARNSGIEWVLNNSPTEWISFIDSDDWIHPQYLEFLLNAAETIHSNISIARFKLSERYSDTYEPINCSNVEIPTEDFFCKTECHPISACGRLFKTKDFENIRFPEKKIHEDRFTTYKILFRYESVAYVDCDLYFCYENPNSITRAEWNPKRIDDIEAIQQQLSFFYREHLKKAYGFAEYEYMKLLLFSLKKIKTNSVYRNYGKKLQKSLRKLYFNNSLNLSLKEKKEVYKYSFPLIYKAKRKLGLID